MKSLHLLLLVAFVIGACTTISIQTPTVMATTTNTLQATETPVATEDPSAQTPSSTPTSTPKSWPISEIPSCTRMEVKDVLPDDYEIQGSLLSIDMPPWSSSGGFGKYPRTRLYNFNLSTRVEKDLAYPEDFQGSAKTKIAYLRIEDLYASPDFLKAVYLITAYEADEVHSKSWLEIYHSDTGERTRVPWDKEWEYIIGWINANYFAIRKGGSTLFLDSYGSNKTSIHTSNLPDYSNPRAYNQYAFVLWGGRREFESYSFEDATPVYLKTHPKIYNPTLEIYNPSMEYVIYTEVVDEKPGIVLYGIESEQKIIEIPTGNEVTAFAFGGEPIWSPDGNSAIMLLPADHNSQRLFLLTISGKVEELTSFELLGPYKWSPDGNSIAFWLADGKQIGVLNINTKELRVLCMDNVYLGERSYFVNDISAGAEFLWLPNNNQLLVEMGKIKNDIRYEGIAIIDIEKALFIDLKWNAILPVWLSK